MANPKVCWESSPFCALINNEAGRGHICQAILNSARNGQIDFFTSTLTLVEVFKVPETLDEEKAEQKISAFFRNRWVRKQIVDWYIAQKLGNCNANFPI